MWEKVVGSQHSYSFDKILMIWKNSYEYAIIQSNIQSTREGSVKMIILVA